MGCSPWGCKESGTTERLTLKEKIKKNAQLNDLLFFETDMFLLFMNEAQILFLV